MANEATASTSPDSQYRVIRRNGQLTPFDGTKISVAVTKAFLAVEGDGAQDSGRIHEIVAKITAQIAGCLNRRL